VLVRTTVHAPRDRVLPLELGFSDRAVVFLNGRALFRGDDSYRSRDYRFLGSIGFWDILYLPLEAARTSSCSRSPRTWVAGRAGPFAEPADRDRSRGGA